MSTRRDARAALRGLGRRPRRRWGQNFLCNRGVAERIVAAAGLEPGRGVLEIGPGLGALTDMLAERGEPLRLVEVDPSLAARLAERHAGHTDLRVVEADVLDVDVTTLWDVDAPGTVVANLPYNVSTPVLFRLLDWRETFPRAVLMLQREVADRLVAPPGIKARGVLSVLVQARARVESLFRVSPGSFLPRPRVQSAVVRIDWHGDDPMGVGPWEPFRTVVRAAFGTRRKMLRNALQSIAESEAIEAALATAGVDSRARAETLSVAQFAAIARELDV